MISKIRLGATTGDARLAVRVAGRRTARRVARTSRRVASQVAGLRADRLAPRIDRRYDIGTLKALLVANTVFLEENSASQQIASHVVALRVSPLACRGRPRRISTGLRTDSAVRRLAPRPSGEPVTRSLRRVTSHVGRPPSECLAQRAGSPIPRPAELPRRWSRRSQTL